MKTLSRSTLQLTVVSLSLLVLLASFYLQYAKGFEPCPLCLIATSLYYFCSRIWLINLYRNLRVVRHSLLLSIFSRYWGFISQLDKYGSCLCQRWSSRCLPGLSVFSSLLPLAWTLKALVWGSGNCTEIRWTWLGLSIPAWSITYFACVAIATVIAYFKLKKSRTIRHDVFRCEVFYQHQDSKARVTRVTTQHGDSLHPPLCQLYSRWRQQYDAYELIDAG